MTDAPTTITTESSVSIVGAVDVETIDATVYEQAAAFAAVAGLFGAPLDVNTVEDGNGNFVEVSLAPRVAE